MPLILLLSLPWLWDNPATEPVDFLVCQAQLLLAGFVQYCDPDCHDEPVYGWAPTERMAVAAPPIQDADVRTPPLGGVTLLDIEARDEAGNVSGACL